MPFVSEEYVKGFFEMSPEDRENFLDWANVNLYQYNPVLNHRIKQFGGFIPGLKDIDLYKKLALDTYAMLLDNSPDLSLPIVKRDTYFNFLTDLYERCPKLGEDETTSRGDATDYFIGIQDRMIEENSALIDHVILPPLNENFEDMKDRLYHAMGAFMVYELISREHFMALEGVSVDEGELN